VLVEAIVMQDGEHVAKQVLVGSFCCPRALCVNIMNLMMFTLVPKNLLGSPNYRLIFPHMFGFRLVALCHVCSTTRFPSHNLFPLFGTRI